MLKFIYILIKISKKRSPNLVIKIRKLPSLTFEVDKKMRFINIKKKAKNFGKCKKNLLSLRIDK